MSPIRNSGRVHTPAPYNPNFDDPNLECSPHFQPRYQHNSEPDGTPFSLSSRSFSSTYSSPSTSGCALSSPSPTPSPAISTSSLSDYAPSVIPRRRISHSRKKTEAHVRRPPNPFIIFRSAFWDEEKKRNTSVKDHRIVSKMAGAAWNKLTSEEKAPYRMVAQQVKVRHQEEHPGYRYAPIVRRGSPARKQVARTEEEERTRCKAIAELIMNGLKGVELAVAIQQLDQASDTLPTPSSVCAPASIPATTSALLDSITSSVKTEEYVLTLPSITPQQEAPAVVHTPELTGAPIDRDPWDSYMPPELKPRFSNPLISGLYPETDVSSSISNPEDPLATLDADTARLLYDTLMNSGALCSLSDNEQSSSTQYFPDPCFADNSSSSYPQRYDHGFQEALGFHSYFESVYADSRAVLGQSDAPDVPTVKKEPQTWTADDFSTWLKTDSF